MSHQLCLMAYFFYRIKNRSTKCLSSTVRKFLLQTGSANYDRESAQTVGITEFIQIDFAKYKKKGSGPNVRSLF